MRRTLPIMAGVLLLLLLLSDGSSAGSDDYVGSWHNKKDGFETIGFGLRSDGRGVFASSVAGTVLRWERTDQGILLRIATDGQTTEIRLTYDTPTKTLSYDRGGGDRQTFWRTSMQEPPDREAQIVEQATKQQQNRPVPKLSNEVFSSCEALLGAIHAWSTFTPPSEPGPGLAAFVRDSETSWRITLRNIGGRYSVEIPLLSKSVEKPTPGVVSYVARSGAEPDLPIRFSLPKHHAEALRQWLTGKGIAFTESAHEARGLWTIERYNTSIDIYVGGDREAFLSIVGYLLNDLFHNSKAPFTLTTMKTG